MHTPGPWRIRPTIPQPDDEGIWCAIVAADTSTVADVHESFDLDSEGDATLIAAAPDLLEAAKDCLSIVGEDPQWGAAVTISALLRAAIEKAEGR